MVTESYKKCGSLKLPAFIQEYINVCSCQGLDACCSMKSCIHSSQTLLMPVVFFAHQRNPMVEKSNKLPCHVVERFSPGLFLRCPIPGKKERFLQAYSTLVKRPNMFLSACETSPSTQMCHSWFPQYARLTQSKDCRNSEIP